MSRTCGPSGYSFTSGATAGAAGAMAVIRDWWHGVYGTSIDDPGVLYAVTLLMGDRTVDDTGNRIATGFDDRWGAGRFRARRFNSAGLRTPMAFAAGSECVTHGSYDFIPMTTTNSGVDVIRAVTWTYDSTHDDPPEGQPGNAFPEIGLRLEYKVSGSKWVPAASSANQDNKQRVHLDNPSPNEWRLRLSGLDISSNGSGCGANSARVYWAWFAESNDRPAGSTVEDVRPEYP
jgi:hypothetical protein